MSISVRVCSLPLIPHSFNYKSPFPFFRDSSCEWRGKKKLAFSHPFHTTTKARQRESKERKKESREKLTISAFLRHCAGICVASNMLDVPNFFWESEPTLHPLYNGVREYLEIKPRIQVLNERCKVFLDLAEMLSDSISDNKSSRECTFFIIIILLPIRTYYSYSDYMYDDAPWKGSKKG